MHQSVRNFIRSFCLLFIISAHFSRSEASATDLSGVDIVKGSPITLHAAEGKGLVVVFLSAICPCSNSHLDELKKLPENFKNFTFVGVHSNTDEGKEQTTQYFKQAALPFPVIQDGTAKIADQFKALKTPHSFVLDATGKILYQGGVSSSREFSKADHQFLREALEDIEAKRTLRRAEGRTLGCIIARGTKNVW